MLTAVYGGADTGRLLCDHPAVGTVSFTGSTAAGREAARRCADGLKPVSLELGGKSRRRVRLRWARNRSTIHRLGSTTKPRMSSLRLTIARTRARAVRQWVTRLPV
ncbi:aldehyde dehydrogenase family protein [Streptomyces sp. NPDC091209]|uniref:aldehyde dehydrogenase family protein n=1 Tax=Streptomyces sp. NPDC091209 TaxID=3365974 RepID=UPI0038228E99